MTTDPINPYISTNPEIAAIVRDDIIRLTSQRKTHELQLKNAGGKAERKAANEAIRAVDEDLARAKASMPPAYLDPDLAKTDIIAKILSADTFAETKAAFIAEFETNPMHTIEWRSNKMVQAQVVHVYFTDLAKHLESLSLAEIPAALREFVAMVTRDMIHAISDSHSSSPFDNVVEKSKLAAMKSIVDGSTRLMWPTMLADRYVAAAVETAALRAEFIAAHAADVEAVQPHI